MTRRPVGLRLIGAPSDVAALLVALRAAGLAPTPPRHHASRLPGRVLAYTTVHIEPQEKP